MVTLTHRTAEYTAMAENFLADRRLSPQDVKTGADAWAIAHRAGITQDAYQDREITDAHIKTVLQRIFPNAVFRDKYTY